MSQRRTVSDLRQNISAILTGIDLDLVNDLYGALERGAGITAQKADVPETMVRQPIMLYDGVVAYTPSENMFGAALIDIRPQGIVSDYLHDVKKTFIVDFDGTSCRTPFGYLVNFEYRAGNPIMRIAQGRTIPRVNIDSMTSLDGWSLGEESNTLLLDHTVYYHQPAALRFNLDVGGSEGTLTKTLENPIDLTDYQGVGVAFLAAYFPDAELITNVSLRLGSDSGNYYEVQVTEGFLGDFYSNDYQLIAFDLANAGVLGTPDISAIQYVEILTSFDGPPTYGEDLIDQSAWNVGTGWTDLMDGSFTHVVGNTADLSQNIASLVPGTHYTLQLTVDGMSGGLSGGLFAGFNPNGFFSGISEDGTYTYDIDTSLFNDATLLTLTPETNFNGTISNISVKQILTPGVGENNVRYGDLFMSLPSPNEALFYSAAVFKAVGSSEYSIYITADTDEVIFRDAAYNIYQYEAARAVIQNQGAGLASDTIYGIDLVLEGDGNKKMGLYQAYRGDNPSEELRTIGSYYDGINDGPGSFDGRNW